MKDCDCNKPCVKTKFDSRIKPSCEQTAVIPTLSVENVDGLKGLSNCLVHVSNTNTVYYIDSRHAIIQTWAGIVTVSDYDKENNPLNLANQIAYDTSNNSLLFFDVHRKYYEPTIGQVEFDNILNRPSYGGEEITSATNIPNVDTVAAGLQSQINAVKNTADSAVQPDDIDIDVLTSLEVDSNISTTVVNLDAGKTNLKTKATSSSQIPLPVASPTQAGVINSAFYNSAYEATQTLNSLLDGAVAITGISASATQQDLTTAWETETGASELINRASIFDVDNNKVWTYYSNTSTWYGVSASSPAVTINTFTNSTAGTIKGSTGVGQVFAENDGTGSVNGWDALSASVANNTSAIAALAAQIQNIMYPVGSIYMSATLSTPEAVANALGGTWEAWGAGRVPVGVGSNGETTYSSAGATGGSDSTTLTTSNLPSHSHSYTEAYSVAGTRLTQAQLPVVTGTAKGIFTHSNTSDQYSGVLSLSAENQTINDPASSSGTKKYGTLRFSMGSGNTHTHSLNTTSSTTGNTGSATAVDNRQSYVTVYMWKRIS